MSAVFDYRIDDRIRTTRIPAGDSFQSGSDPRPILVLDPTERIDELRMQSQSV